MEIEITEYVTKLSNQEMTPQTSQNIRSILNICNDLERIGDIYFQISKTMEQKIENRIFFTPDQRNNINEMLALLHKAFAEMNANLMQPYIKVSKHKALELEKLINAKKDKLRQHNLSRLGDEDYNVNSAMIYNNLFSLLEEVGNHIINITEAIVGEI